MALGLGDYKSDIALVGCYNIYIYTLNPMESSHRDGPVSHKNVCTLKDDRLVCYVPLQRTLKQWSAQLC